MASNQRHRNAPPALWIELVVVAGFCALFAFLASRQIASTSATFDEVTHLPAGYSYLRWHDYRMNPEHPPLAKAFAALPLLAMNPWPALADLTGDPRDPSPSRRWLNRTWTSAVLDPDQAQWVFGHEMLYGVRDQTLRSLGVEAPEVPASSRLQRADFLNDADAILAAGRSMILLLGVALAVLVYLWARNIFGMAGGVLALGLLALDPNFLAHSGLVTTDVPVTLLFFGAVYFLWRACRRLTVVNALLTALFVALAFVTKFSALLLVPVFAILGLVRIFDHAPWPGITRTMTTLSQRITAVAALPILCGAAAILAIWASYDFRYSAMADPQHAAAAMRAYLPPDYKMEHEAGTLPIGNVVQNTAAIRSLLARHPRAPTPEEIQAALPYAKPGALGTLLLFAQSHRLLPEAWIYGLAFTEMTSLQRSAFLMGSYSDRGFPSYFFWTFLFKTPLPALLLILAAVVVAVRRRLPWSSQMAFLTVPVAVYLAASLATNLNIGHRHLLPTYPFLFVLCGALVLPWRSWRPVTRKWTAAAALALIALSSAVVFAPPWKPQLVPPHYLAYFNELAGGPRNGYRQLVDSNLDWGQDLPALKAWIDQHVAGDQMINLVYFGTADPRYYGIPHINMPGGYMFEKSEDYLKTPDGTIGVTHAISPGYLAISATNLQAVYYSDEARGWWRNILSHATLVDTIGYSIFIYKIDGIPTK